MPASVRRDSATRSSDSQASALGGDGAVALVARVAREQVGVARERDVLVDLGRGAGSAPGFGRRSGSRAGPWKRASMNSSAAAERR
jgi:hypothetical protein